MSFMSFGEPLDWVSKIVSEMSKSVYVTLVYMFSLFALKKLLLCSFRLNTFAFVLEKS